MNPTKMKKEELVKEVLTLRDKLINQDATIDDLKAQAKEANAVKDEQASAIDNLKNCLEESQETVAKKDKELKEVKETLDDYKNDVVEKTKEIQNLRKQNGDLRVQATDVETLKEQIATSNSRIKLWKSIAIGAVIVFLIALCVIVS